MGRSSPGLTTGPIHVHQSLWPLLCAWPLLCEWLWTLLCAWPLLCAWLWNLLCASFRVAMDLRCLCTLAGRQTPATSVTPGESLRSLALERLLGPLQADREGRMVTC